MVDKISKLRRCALRLQEELDREPTDEELAEELGTSPWRVRQMRQAALPPASLDAPIDQEGAGALGEIGEDDKAENPFEELRNKTTTGMLQQMVRSLSGREATILSARFGLDGNSPKTLESLQPQGQYDYCALLDWMEGDFKGFRFQGAFGKLSALPVVKVPL